MPVVPRQGSTPVPDHCQEVEVTFAPNPANSTSARITIRNANNDVIQEIGTIDTGARRRIKTNVNQPPAGEVYILYNSGPASINVDFS
jgi:hypothetical protein